MTRSGRWLGTLGVMGVSVALGLATHAGARRHASADLRPLWGCADGVLVGGELRCGDEVVGALTQLCGGPPTELEVWAGDRLDLPVCYAARPARGGPGWTRMPPRDLNALGIPVSLNAASAGDLQSLHGVGPALAERIIAARPFAQVGELDQVRGIGPRTLAGVRHRIAVDPPVTLPRRSR